MQGTVINDNMCSPSKRWDLVPQDLYTDLIWMVVKNRPEEQQRGSSHWLLFENRVLHEFESIADFCGNFGWAFVDNAGQILDDEVEIWEALSKSYRDRSALIELDMFQDCLILG